MKFQAPTFKHQRNFKHEAPICAARIGLDVEAWSFFGCWSLEFGAFIWRFSGAWMLEFGAFIYEP
jgi:hypothetical protein